MNRQRIEGQEANICIDTLDSKPKYRMARIFRCGLFLWHNRPTEDPVRLLVYIRELWALLGQTQGPKYQAYPSTKDHIAPLEFIPLKQWKHDLLQLLCLPG